MPPVSVTVGTSPTLLGTCKQGQGILIQNTGSATVYFGDETDPANLTTTNGLQLLAGQQFSESYNPAPEGGPPSLTWYGMVASGSGTVIVSEGL